MKAKILLIIAVVALLVVDKVQAVDVDFYSDGVIEDGDVYNVVRIYDTPPDHTTVDMLGGHVDSMGAYDASTVNVTGGDVSTLEAHEFSTANVSGGYVYTLWAWDWGTATLSETGSVSHLSASGNFGTANMCGGSAGWVDALDSGTVNLYAGIVSDYLSAPDGTINVFGYDLSKTATGGSYGYGFITGYWDNDTSFVIDLLSPETHSHINLITVIDVEIEILPNTLNLESEGTWLTCRIQLPEAYNVNDIDPDTILIERRFKAEWLWFNEEKQVVMAKFNRADVCEILEAGDIDLTVTGHLVDGTCFEGTDTIKVIDKGGKKK